MRHDPDLRTLKQGENLAWQWSSVPNYAATANIYGTKGVDDWYFEVHDFDYFNYFDNNERPPKGSGHFTQVVWKDTKRLGCGAKGDYLVCRYQPQGNMRMGPTYASYEENVGRL